MKKPTRSPQKPKLQDIRQEAKENNLKADIVAVSSDAKYVVKTTDGIRLREQPTRVLYKNDDNLEIVSIDYIENPKTNKQLNKEDATKNDKRENHQSIKKNQQIYLRKIPKSLDILSKIDELIKDDIKQTNEVHEPM